MHDSSILIQSRHIPLLEKHELETDYRKGTKSVTKYDRISDKLVLNSVTKIFIAKFLSLNPSQNC